MTKAYYSKIEQYYDEDAVDFDARYWKNRVLQRIRQDFREQVKRFRFQRMLEIGFGTGLDMEHFAVTFPNASVTGIDISGEMQKVAKKRFSAARLSNAVAMKGSVEDIHILTGEQKFDMVYVFFGALNTVEDLKQAAAEIHRCTEPGGILVLSFVNKHYVGGMIIELFKLRFRAAFSRMKTMWGGYSPSKFLPSRCYSPGQIESAFRDFVILKRKGYSILHPAWYYHRLNRLLLRFSPWLWRADEVMNRSVFWRFGEYTLFVLRKPEP
jgi:ubiquinone/menaquinone biosynthesis C-methylase UbiE